MLESITERTKDILLDTDKRKTFFEKLQSDLTSQKDTELISEFEISELFERIGLELQVAPFEPVREDDVVQAQQSSVASEYRATIENTELDEMFIKDGILMMIDETLTKVAMEAQDKGKERDIQVFRPIPFLRTSSLRFDQIKQEQMDLTRVVVAAREEENELNSSNKNNFRKDELMMY